MANYYNTLPSRTRASPNPAPNTTRRSWSNNGVHFTMETTSFAIPGGSFSGFSTTANGASRDVFPLTANLARTVSGGMLGAAFGLLGGMLSSQQQPASRGSRRRGSRQASVTDERQSTRANQKADRVRDGTNDVRKGPETDDYSESDGSHAARSRRSSRKDQEAAIEDLEDAADHHRREIRRLKRRLEQASRRDEIDAAALQSLIDEIRAHEISYEDVKSALDHAKRTSQNPSSSRQLPRRSKTAEARQTSPTADDVFANMFSMDDFDSFFQSSRPSRTLFDDFNTFSFRSTPSGFSSNFGTASPFDDPFFATPRPAGPSFGGTTRSRSGFRTTTGNGPQFYPTPIPPNPPVPTWQPPKNLLKIDEAKKLFEEYNKRWNGLAPTDPNIPFPCRGLQRQGLVARDSIWNPSVTSPVSAWSESQVMQANSQAFFLAVVGLKPTYSEAPGTGKLLTGYDKLRATPEQVRELVEILKKEKTRWHSDRLGRRNGGMANGANEALQKDEKARAVFHAVCELTETTQQ